MVEVAIDEGLPFALTWTVAEPMERSSHALASGGKVWLVDPVADDRALAAAERLGEIAAVIQLLDRHRRDCSEVASRYGVEHQRLPDRIDGAPFEPLPVISLPRWREVALRWPDESLLVVAEAVGSAASFAAGQGPLGMHPFLRPYPPSVLRDLSADRILVGHGPPLHAGGTAALSEALERSRRDIPRAIGAMVRAFSRGG